MKVVHNNNGYCTLIGYENGLYKIYFNSINRTEMCSFASKKERKVEDVVKNYIELVNLLGQAKKNGWTPKFPFENRSIRFYDENSNRMVECPIKLGRVLSNKVWQKAKQAFPVGGPDDFTTQNDLMAKRLLTVAAEIRRDSLQNILLESPEVEVDHILNTLDNLKDPKTDIQKVLK